MTEQAALSLVSARWQSPVGRGRCVHPLQHPSDVDVREMGGIAAATCPAAWPCQGTALDEFLFKEEQSC